MSRPSLVFEMEEVMDGDGVATDGNGTGGAPKRRRSPQQRGTTGKGRRAIGGVNVDGRQTQTPPPRSPRRVFDAGGAHTPGSNVFELEEVDQSATRMADHIRVEAVCSPVAPREVHHVEETAWRVHHRRRRRRGAGGGGGGGETRGGPLPPLPPPIPTPHPADDDGGAIGEGDGGGGDVSDEDDDEASSSSSSDDDDDSSYGGGAKGRRGKASPAKKKKKKKPRDRRGRIDDESSASAPPGDVRGDDGPGNRGDDGDGDGDGEDGDDPGPSEEELERERRPDLGPLLPAPPLPPLPPNWSFDDTTRVLLGDLRMSRGRDGAGGRGRIGSEDERFMLRMMERDDVTVVTEGLVLPEELDPTLWSMDYLRDTVGGEVYHRFRVFERAWEEVDEGGCGGGGGDYVGGEGDGGDGDDGDCSGSEGDSDASDDRGGAAAAAATAPAAAAATATGGVCIGGSGSAGSAVVWESSIYDPPPPPRPRRRGGGRGSDAGPPRDGVAGDDDGGDGTVSRNRDDDDDDDHHEIISDPHENDVLIQHGGSSTRLGNLLLKRLASERRDRYHAANPSKLRGTQRRAANDERQAMAIQIVRAVVESQNPPGRFLKKVSGRVGADGSSPLYEVLGEKGCIKKAKKAMGYVGKAPMTLPPPPPPPPHEKLEWNGNSGTAVQMSLTVSAGTCASSSPPLSPGAARKGATSAAADAPPSLPPHLAAATSASASAETSAVEFDALAAVPPRKWAIVPPAAAKAAQPLLPPPPAAATAASTSASASASASVEASAVETAALAAASPRDGVTRGNEGDGVVTRRRDDDDDRKIITDPHPNDVIIQKSMSSQAGNHLLNALASERRERYHAFNPNKLKGAQRKAANNGRQALARQIVRAIHDQDPPGRFLKKVEGRVGADLSPLYEVVGEKGCINRAKSAMGYVPKSSATSVEKLTQPLPPPEEVQQNGNRDTAARNPWKVPAGTCVSSSPPPSSGGAKEEAMSAATAAPASLPPPATAASASVETSAVALAAASPRDGVTRGNEGDGVVTRRRDDDDDRKIITDPNANDVIIQVGGQQKVSSRAGNKLLDALASERRERYLALNPNRLKGAERKAANNERQALAKQIVRAIHGQDPPGRFLWKVEGRVGADTSPLYEVGGEKGCINRAKSAMGRVPKAPATSAEELTQPLPPPEELQHNANRDTAVRKPLNVPAGTRVSSSPPPSSGGVKEEAVSTATAAPPSLPPPPATAFAAATEPMNGHHHQRRPCPWAESHAEAKPSKEPSAAATSKPPLGPPPGTAVPKPTNGNHPAHSHYNLSPPSSSPLTGVGARIEKKDVTTSAPSPSPSRSTRAAAAASEPPTNGHHHLHVHLPVAVPSSSSSHGQRSWTLPPPPPSPPPPIGDAVPQLAAAASPTKADGDGDDGRHGPGHKRYHVTHRETGSCRALRMRDFVRYLEERERHLSAIAARAGRRRRRRKTGRECCAVGSSSRQRQPESPEEEARCRRNSDGEEMFRYEDEDGNERSFNCVDTVLYLIDYDMVKLLPALHRDFVGRFRFPEILPGGGHCLMNKINPGGRPFMGPNLYVTPPSAFTHFHQDGHGTVDSGHQCLSGYNEVIMLRRMTEEHKKHALFLLNGEDPIMYDALYGLPHADGKRDMPQWPSSEDIQRCRDMNYYPSVFVLKPGQFVHINKGRLHAFRKMAPTRLRERDCHYGLRSTLLSKNPDLANVERLCVSVAWDWTYKGVTSDGTNRETAAVLECASLNRRNQTNSLAIPETSILYLARELSNKCREEERSEEKNLGMKKMLCSPIQPRPSSFAYQPKAIVTLRGILPSLRHVVERHKAAYMVARQDMTQCNGPRVSVASRPNSWENPQLFTLDPYGNDFFCKLCHEELSNLYMHCDGCEMILNKDFNICVSCHSEGKYKVRIQMHPLNEKKHSTINHTGDFRLNRQSRCPCRNGPACRNCSYCAGCSCKCHQHFTLQYRFMDINDEVKLLERVESAVGSRTVRYAAETEERLLASRPLPSVTTSAVTCEEATCDGRGAEDLEEEQASEMVTVNGVKRKGTILFPNGLEAARRKIASTGEPEKGKLQSVCHTERRRTSHRRK